MFWKRGGREVPRGRPEEGAEGKPALIRIERDAERPATILRVATELERRGAEIVELFKEIKTDHRRAVLPIHLRWQEQDFFVEIETRRWRQSTVDKALNAAAALRASEYPAAGLGLLSAYPTPEEVLFFFGKSPLALFQLDLYGENPADPEESAAAFVHAARRQWDASLGYDLGSLSTAEELLMRAMSEPQDPDWPGGPPPVLDVAVESLGYYLGEVIRRSSGLSGAWTPSRGWGEALVLELGEFSLDPIGKARAFLANGAEDSVAYYAGYALDELETLAPGSHSQA